MNGIEKITARIAADAQAEAEQILREAEARAAEIRAGYQAKAAAESEEADAAGQEAARHQLQRLESSARMDGKKLLLETKQACLDDAFAKSREQLLSMSDEEYAAFLAQMAAGAARTGREEIILNRRDYERLGDQVVSKANALLAEANAPALAEDLKGSRAGDLLSKVVAGASALIQGTAMLTLSPETREMEGGLILRDGNVEINCTFETQLRVLRETMAAEVAAILFA